MKKRALLLISLLLALLMLGGCALPFSVPGGDHVPQEKTVPELKSFDEIEYVRPDIDEINAKAEELYAALLNPLKFKQVSGLLDEFYSLCSNFNTMYVVANIRNSKDLTDEYYAGEYSWLLEADTQVQMTVEEVYAACAQSPHSLWLESLKFWEGFADEYLDSGKEEDELYERYMWLMERESQLLSEYRGIMAEPSIEIDGQEWDYDEYLLHADSDGYIAAGEAYYKKYNPLLGQLYIELIQIRRECAELMGYDSFAAMAYELSYGRDYSPEESERYMEYVKRHLAELGRQMNESGAYYELYYEEVSERELLLFLETAAEGFGGIIEESFRFMKDYGMYDFELSPYKLQSSFQTYLEDYEAPFLFLCPYGDTEDITVVFHEFGHYADCYIRENAYESMDLAESFSQAMQFLCMSGLECVMNGEELDNLRRMNLLDILDAFLIQTALAEFEMRAYELEEPTVEKLNELCLELAKDYGYYEEQGGEVYAYTWTDTGHLFENPFYVISYPVSAGLALELYELELEKEGEGIAKFIEMSESRLAGLMETVDYAGLENPMSEARIMAATDFLREQLAA